MSVKSRAQLKTDTNNIVFENSTKSIHATDDNGLRIDVIDSFPNLIDDASLFGLSEFSPAVSYIENQCVAYQGGIFQCVNPAGHIGAWVESDFNLIAGNSSEEGVIATGTDQATAYQVSKKITFVDTTAAGTGLVLDTAQLNKERVVWNFGANDLLLYPATGQDLGEGVNTPITLASGAGINLIATTGIKWRQI